MHYDVFNGDADGICALHQLRLADPKPSRIITGVKRDIKLLAKLLEKEKGLLTKGASITVLDISMNSNMAELLLLLKSCWVLYIDHHFAGEIPDSTSLEAHIDAGSDVCTSLIVDRMLGGKYRPWAVVAAFGDNLHEAARSAAGSAFNEDSLARLRELGELMNYNGYGKTIEDLHFAPAALYEAVKPYEDPLAFYEDSNVLVQLREGFHGDMAKARDKSPIHEGKEGRIFQFPGESWARRVAGVFSNEAARERPDCAHALLVDNNDGTFLVSVRAPLSRKAGADVLCRMFPTGGGRAAAAGINALPADRAADFKRSFKEVFTP